jgi:hypothetical protein
VITVQPSAPYPVPLSTSEKLDQILAKIQELVPAPAAKEDWRPPEHETPEHRKARLAVKEIRRRKYLRRFARIGRMRAT